MQEITADLAQLTHLNRCSHTHQIEGIGTTSGITTDQGLVFAVTTSRTVGGREVDHATRHISRLQCPGGHADALYDAEHFNGVDNQITPKGRLLQASDPAVIGITDGDA